MYLQQENTFGTADPLLFNSPWFFNSASLTGYVVEHECSYSYDGDSFASSPPYTNTLLHHSLTQTLSNPEFLPMKKLLKNCPLGR